MSGELLFEIGTEEIPSEYLNEGLRQLRSLAETCLKEKLIRFGEGLEAYGTPRRLVLIGKALADKQEDAVQEIMGPPKKAAFDEQGNPTRAALGFANKHGLTIDNIEILKTPKGEYLYVRKEIPGKPAMEVLSEVLPRLIADMPWPKSMRWGSIGFSFVRPIHWVLALFNGRVIPFEAAGVKSGNATRGHRFMSPQAMEIKDVQDYLQKMAKASVIIGHEERVKRVEEALSRVAERASGVPGKDPELLSIVANLVESPSALCGSFDKVFLDLPDQVLITAMKKHQRYFPLYDHDGRLMPNFVAVNNTLARDESVVRRGHERVLRARLADAAFFFKEDRKRPLLDRLEDLKKVIYQADLGASFAKVMRFSKLAEYLGEELAPARVDDIRLAARLCKCDLVTEMVSEFPELQGVMGEQYALLDGHPREVCLAVREHYLPERAGGDLPTSLIGALIGIADRMDTIAGCFAVGLEPTGAADPFALRRHALAIMRILEGFEWETSLLSFISKSLSILEEEISFDKALVFDKVRDFFRERYKQMMLRSDYTSDLIEAVISVAFDQIGRLRPRIDHLAKFSRESDEFESLVLAFKRVSNILKNQAQALDVVPELFQEPCESRLWEAYQEVKEDIHRQMDERNYLEALRLMLRLRGPVDELFDGVEIMTKENPRLRNNRVGLLQELARLFLSLADFSKFSL
ncbi:MAG: glycine--tRNA ligase subunit beta [Desulfobacterales bacterium]|nr:glycine--tRNA ligase subunit beta [Desulfobacterales bacterium]